MVIVDVIRLVVTGAVPETGTEMGVDPMAPELDPGEGGIEDELPWNLEELRLPGRPEEIDGKLDELTLPEKPTIRKVAC